MKYHLVWITHFSSHLSLIRTPLPHSSNQTELLYYVLGKKKFPNSPTANLERFIQRFNEVAYWVATELCLCADYAKQARMLKKFIAIATMWVWHITTYITSCPFQINVIGYAASKTMVVMCSSEEMNSILRLILALLTSWDVLKCSCSSCLILE